MTSPEPQSVSPAGAPDEDLLVERLDPRDHPEFARPLRTSDDYDGDQQDLADRLSLRRVVGMSTELADVKRIDLAGAVTLVGATVVGYYVLSLVSDAGAIWDALSAARWELLPWLLVLMVLQYVAGAVTLRVGDAARTGSAVRLNPTTTGSWSDDRRGSGE